MRNFRIIPLLAAVLLSTAAWGVTKVSPTKDVNYRATNATTWNNDFPKPASTAANATFECRWGSGLFAIQEYQIENFDEATSFTLVLTKGGGGGGEMVIWEYDQEPPITKVDATTFFSHVGSIVGATVAASVSADFTKYLAESRCHNNMWVFRFRKEDLKHYSLSGTTATVRFLISTKDQSSSASNAHFKSSNEDNATELERPRLLVNYGYDNPAKEYQYRFNRSGEGVVSWNSLYTHVNKSVTFETRCESGYYIFDVLQFYIYDFDPANVYTFVAKKNLGDNTMYIWDFPYTSLPSSIAESVDAFATAFQSTTGINISENTYTFSGQIDSKNVSDSKWTFVIPGDKLTATRLDAHVSSVNLLLVTSAASRYYTNNEGNTEANLPTLVKTGRRTAKIGSTYYDSYSEAYDALDDGQTLTLFKDVETNTQFSKTSMSVTIDGNGYTLTNSGLKTSNLFQIGVSTSLTVKNLTIDGDNLTGVTQKVFERNGEGAALTLQNVIIRNVQTSTSQGVICTKGSSGGDVIFDNVIFDNCSCTDANASLIFVGVSNAYFKNAITFNDCGESHVFMEKSKRIFIKDSFTPSVPLAITLKSDFSDNGDAIEYESNITDESLGKCRLLGNWYSYISSNPKMAKAKQFTSESSITLNDNANNATILHQYNCREVDVTLNRTIVRSGTEYSTFCAPFAISRTDLESQLGTTEVLRLKRVDAGATEDVYVFDDDVEDLEAGVPYLIKPAADDNVTSLTFEDVTIDKTMHPVELGDYSFIPLFSQSTIANASQASAKSVVYLGAGNQLYYAAANASVKGFRAYFQVPETPASAPARRMRIGYAHQTPTGIENQTVNGKCQNCKLIRNGQVLIVRDGVEYNTFGQRIQ